MKYLKKYNEDIDSELVSDDFPDGKYTYSRISIDYLVGKVITKIFVPN